jgi:hypothetical protein
MVRVVGSPAEAKERTRTAGEAGPEPGALDEAGAERVVASGRLVRTRRLQDPPERRRGRVSGTGAGTPSGAGVGAARRDPGAGGRGKGPALEERRRTEAAARGAA